ncbi:MAG: DUF2851 family protein [Paludibacter sp.]|nr:DUF2851 family protein [Paludibacter sp.]MDD4428243.1 DUF2851 family protein [Paludibacter sp.]
MKELVLHYIWQHKLFVQHDLHTTDGQRIEVIDVGKPNTHAGPDFFNAKIRIGKTIWAGNVEIHNLASDWNKHRHQQDKNYGNVILHVVKKADVPVFLADGQKLPQLELSYATEIETNYEMLVSGTKWIACADKISGVPEIYIRAWKNALLMERMEQKVQEINALLQSGSNHWEETCFVIVSKCFGFSVNNEAFLSLAKSLPLMLILKNCRDVVQLEALLFGQSGLLKELTCQDDYIEELKREYAFLQQKYRLQPKDGKQWRLLRLRPDNFPYIRIAQLASVFYKRQQLFSQLLDRPDITSLMQLFDEVEVSEYWKSHYIPGEVHAPKSKKLGQESVYGILINAVVPLLFCYGAHKELQNLKDKALQMLEKIPAENNYITRRWRETGLTLDSAADSQALICLYKKYCEAKNCLRCRIGHRVLTSNV